MTSFNKFSFAEIRNEQQKFGWTIIRNFSLQLDVEQETNIMESKSAVLFLTD